MVIGTIQIIENIRIDLKLGDNVPSDEATTPNKTISNIAELDNEPFGYNIIPAEPQAIAETNTPNRNILSHFFIEKGLTFTAIWNR